MTIYFDHLRFKISQKAGDTRITLFKKSKETSKCRESAYRQVYSEDYGRRVSPGELHALGRALIKNLKKE